jgi:transposase-like protein
MPNDAVGDGGLRYYRHSEMFWRDLIARQPESGQGVRKFCLANGVPPSTFHKWRAALRERPAAARQAPISTPDAMFIPILHDADRAVESLPEPPRGPSSKVTARDSVIVTSGGMRVELTGACADRIVRHLLGRMNGFSC